MPVKGLLKVPVVYTGSVKNLRQKKKPSGSRPGVLWFEYTDAYSVFDYGKMPDEIADKGAAAAMMTACLFDEIARPATWKAFHKTGVLDKVKCKTMRRELADSQALKNMRISGLATHYQGVVNDEGRCVALDKLSKPSQVLQVAGVRIIHPQTAVIRGRRLYNYTMFSPGMKNHLAPLECIFRFGLPKGSSLLERLAKNPEYAEEIGISANAKEGSTLFRPVMEFSTKLEPADRYISYEFAMNAAGMEAEEFTNLLHGMTLSALWLKEKFLSIGLKLWDGKFEFLRLGEGLALGDAITPDELRLTYKKLQVSKELLRQYHNIHQPEFAEAMDKAKKIAQRDDRSLPKIVADLGHSPKPVDPAVISAMSDMYAGITERLMGRDIFGGRADLADVVKKLKKLGIG